MTETTKTTMDLTIRDLVRMTFAKGTRKEIQELEEEIGHVLTNKVILDDNGEPESFEGTLCLKSSYAGYIVTDTRKLKETE